MKKPVAIGIMCKTPIPGSSKTRLSPPLSAAECAEISACFIRDLANTIHELSLSADVVPYAVYTPEGSEESLRRLLPDSFRLALQCEGGFGVRLLDPKTLAVFRTYAIQENETVILYHRS